MSILYRSLTITALVLTSGLMAGCASQQELIPDTGPDILDVYDRHMQQSSQTPNMWREIRDGRRDLSDYTRSAATELDTRFPKLPNPELVMYVFPHLTAKGRPVPGYVTTFSMYETTHYALPGEVAP